MTPEDLVHDVTTALPGKILSAILYGSAAAGDHVPGTSNYNVLLIVDRLGLAELDALSEPAQRWARAGNRPPLLFAHGQLESSADVFPIEILDMRQSRRVLFGEDALAGIAIDHEHLRLQIERDLKAKLLVLREGYLLTGGKRAAVLELLTSSVAGFLVLFRAALRLFQDEVPAHKLDALQLLTGHIKFDPHPLREVDALRHRRRKPREVVAETLFESYLTTIQQVVDAIDRHLHREQGDVTS